MDKFQAVVTLMTMVQVLKLSKEDQIKFMKSNSQEGMGDQVHVFNNTVLKCHHKLQGLLTLTRVVL